MTKIIFTRHGETVENVEKISQGDPQNSITEKGKNHITELCKRLAKEKIDLIISSDMHRCKETAQLLAQTIKAPIVHSQLIREKSNGDWIGKPHKEIDWNSLKGDFENRKPPNGENLLEVRERGKKFIRELLEQHEGKNVLVVTHGAFLKVLLGDLLGMTLHNSIFKLHIDHCSISAVDAKSKDDYKVLQLNNQDFLM